MCTTPFTGHSPGFKTINLNFLLNYFIKLTADDQRSTSADVYVVQSSIFALYKQQYTLKCEIFTFLFGSFSLWGKFLEKIFLFGHFEIKPTNADTLNSLIFLIILMCTFNFKKHLWEFEWTQSVLGLISLTVINPFVYFDISTWDWSCEWLTSSVWAPGASTCRSAESGSRIYGSRPRPASCGADWDRLIPPRPPSRIWSSMVLRPGAPMDRKSASRNTAGPALQFLHKQQRERVASQDVFSCASD